MTFRKYFYKSYLIYLFCIFCTNLFLYNRAEEIREIDNFSNSSRSKIKWKKFYDNNFIKNKKLYWEEYKPEIINETTGENEIQKIFNKRFDSEKKQSNNEFLYFGFSVPTADVMNKKDFLIYADQLFPFYRSEFEEGSANQNYSVFLAYGISEKFTMMGFFSHSDDPLYSKINNLDKQPANKWISLGLGSRFNFLKNNQILTSIDTSIEAWYVKSGGCNGIGCTGTSYNIFDQSLNEFENLNLIGSIALPTTYKISKNTNLVFSPKLTFLPAEQSNKGKSGSFYGFNTGIGIGLSHKFSKRFQIYNSNYIPLTGHNYFDDNLNFNKAVIYDFGFNYLIDPKISFQSYLTNSFGATPATGILTIPSDNNLIIGTRLIYKPTSLDLENQVNIANQKKFDGLSVTNSNIIDPNQVLFDISFDKDAEVWTKITTGISRNFNFEIVTGKSNKKSNLENTFFTDYLGSNSQNLRFGGKAILIKQNDYFPITSGFRMTFGRSLGESWPGYLFFENINTIKLSQRIELGITPKIAWTGSDNPSAIGTSLIFDLNDYYSIILESNTAFSNAESNLTSALRISNNHNRYLDLYVSNALNFSDMGELINAKEIIYGLKFGFKF